MSKNYPAPFRGRGYPTMTNREIDQRALLIAKDAEIERLKEHIIFLVGVSTLKDKLITELCDALGAKTLWLNRDDIALLQRAREATR